VKDLYGSYKDLPLTLYQIQTKFRDEARPRAGLLRAREFVMKDSYSFDVDDAGLGRSYQRHREAYVRIFDRLGLPTVVVSAVSGAMGGSASEEFLHPSEHGEDTYVRTEGGYAANVEAVTTPAPEPLPAEQVAALPPAHVEDTPDTPTIEALVAVANERFPVPGRPWTAADTLKNVVVRLRHPDGTREPLVVGLPGNRDVDPKRLEAAVSPAEVEPFEAADFAAHPTLVRGYIGPTALGSAKGVRYLLDPRVVAGTRWITGANEPGRHVFDLVAGRDFPAAGQEGSDGTVEAATVLAGDPAPDGSGPLQLARGMEMGHIFQLGRKYADALGLQVLDQNGKLVTVTMGSYGIGVSRAVAALAEAGADELGLRWPRAVTPADVHVVAAGKDDAVAEASEALAAELVAAGLTVLLDDRPRVSPGVKFKDAELLGVPTIVTVGKRLADGVVEVRDRSVGGDGARTDVAVADAAAHLLALVRS
jgi:prolyl-tRNA synthetase